MREESSFGLVERAKAGDSSALHRLVQRYIPRLRQSIHRRLPAWARTRAETEDLVQDTLLNAVRHLPTFEMRHDYSWRAFMKTLAQNEVRDEIKWNTRHPSLEVLDREVPNQHPSPEQYLISREDLRFFRVALMRLRPKERTLILLALKEGRDSHKLAECTGQSAGAARVALTRALARLTEEMERLAS